MESAVSELLRNLAARVERNVPHHRDPERFHAEKSEIAAALRRLACGQPPRRRARFFRATVSQ
jgi:hypothetical protein